MSGAGGEGPAISTSDSAGQGGADEEAPCTSDLECLDRSACNGDEACVEGKCELGLPPQCPLPTMLCQDDAPELCVFEAPSPWLVFGTGAGLEALPTSAIGVAPPVVLATTSTKRSLGLLGAFFSMRGDLAISVRADREFLVHLEYLRFGAGLPAAPRSIPDVPDLIDVLSGPWLAPDSSYAFVLDDYTGAFLAPLADPKASTIHFPLADFDITEAEFCEEARTFWYAELEGTVSIATLTEGGVVTRKTAGDGWPVFSPDRRFIMQGRQLDPEAEAPQPGVVVSRCSAHESDTVFEGASDPLIGPDSQSVLLRYEDGSSKLFSLEQPEDQRELWSSQGRRMDEAAFSADGRRLVGLIDDVWHVATVASGEPPAPLELPAASRPERVSADGGYIPLVGDAALVAYLPEDSEHGRALVWQALVPENAPHVLVPAREAGQVALLVSGSNVNELFMAVRDSEGSEKLSRVRLDTPRPELEELFSLDGDIAGLERAPDGSGLAILLSVLGLQSSLWWAPLTADDEVEAPFVLSPDVYSVAFQPRP